MDNAQQMDNEIEIDLKELFLELVSFWKLILLALVLGAGIAYAASRFLMVPQYESVSELYVLSKSTSITSLADIQAGTSLTNDYMVVVKGRPVLEQVISNLDLNETYESLEGKVTLENPSNSRILKITVRDKNPTMAKAIADEIANVGAAPVLVEELTSALFIDFLQRRSMVKQRRMHIGTNLVEQAAGLFAVGTLAHQCLALLQQDVGIAEDRQVVALVTPIAVVLVDDEELDGPVALSPTLDIVTDVKVLPVVVDQADVMSQHQRIAVTVEGDLRGGQQCLRVIDMHCIAQHTVVALRRR